MAKTYRTSRATRLINSLFRTLTRFGLGASYRHILTVQGRKTGRLYSTPVDVLELGGQRWLVAAYGPTSWVANTRAAGEVTLSRGGRPAVRGRGSRADGRGLLAPLYRHWQVRWGAADAEVAAAMPGDELLHHPSFNATRAITIDAPPEEVWPWLVRLRQGRKPDPAGPCG